MIKMNKKKQKLHEKYNQKKKQKIGNKIPIY